MRREADISAGKIVDLGDQPKGEYLLYYGMPGNSLAAIWVDRLESGSGTILGFRAGALVTMFSTMLPWALVHKDTIEIETVSEYREMERGNLAARLRFKQDLDRIAATIVGPGQGPPTYGESYER